MKVTVILIVISASGTILKRFIKELEDLETRGQVVPIQTMALLRSSEYGGESWRLEETWCHSDSDEELSANAGMKNSQKSKMIITKGLIQGLEDLEITGRVETVELFHIYTECKQITYAKLNRLK